MRNAFFLFLTLMTASSVFASKSTPPGVVNIIKAGPVSEECLSRIKPGMDLESSDTLACLDDLLSRTKSLLIGMRSCARLHRHGIPEEACHTIARQMHEIKEPYNNLMEIISKRANMDQEEITGVLIGGETLDLEISHWYQPGS